MLRIPHCLDNRLTDGGKVVSPTHPPHFTRQKHYYFYVSGNHFCYNLSKPQGLVRPEGLGKFKKSPHRVSNPPPSGLQHSALITTLTRAPQLTEYCYELVSIKKSSKYLPSRIRLESLPTEVITSISYIEMSFFLSPYR
jgi:hypothetical protein